MSMPCISAHTISKSFHVYAVEQTSFRWLRALLRGEQQKRELWAFRDLTFTIERGDRIALIGRNAAGKTTLLRVLAGIFSLTHGRIDVAGSVLTLLNMSLGFISELSVLDTIYVAGACYGMSRDEVDNQVAAILAMAEFNSLQHMKIRELSAGQLQRLAFSIFSKAHGDIVLVDESLSFIDKGFSHVCDNYFNALVESEKTLIMTAHEKSILKKYCTKALWLEGGIIRRYGPFDEVHAHYEEALTYHD